MSGSEKSIERQRDKAPFRENEEHYRAVAEAATDAIITIDSDSTILIVNPAAERIFGYSSEEMIGQPLTMLMPEYLRHLHEAGITRYRETGHKHIQWSAVQLPGLHKIGNEIPLEISFAEFSRDGRRFFTGIARDISERKRLQDRQARLARHAVLHAEVSAAVSESEKSTREMLQICAAAVVRHLDAAFARIWLLNNDKVLELAASAGLYTHLDGAHARIPVGSFKIGFKNLRTIFRTHGIEILWEMRENGINYGLELSVFEPYYNGNEGYWCDGTIEWIIYASHEAR